MRVLFLPGIFSETEAWAVNVWRCRAPAIASHDGHGYNTLCDQHSCPVAA